MTGEGKNTNFEVNGYLGALHLVASISLIKLEHKTSGENERSGARRNLGLRRVVSIQLGEVKAGAKEWPQSMGCVGLRTVKKRRPPTCICNKRELNKQMTGSQTLEHYATAIKKDIFAHLGA